MKDYYKVLGIDRNASEAEIKNAYRRLAKKYHPDVSQETDATQKFQELQEAYSILKDPQKKSAYDNPQQRVHQHYHQHGGHDPFSSFQDIFDILRRRHGTSYREVKTYTIRLTLEEAYTGTTRNIDGSTFRVPPGVRTGNRLSVSDFYVDVLVLHHPKYRRAGDDLLITVTVNAFEAILGTELIIQHIDGTQLKSKIPAGIQHGQVLRLQNKGMPNPEVAGRRGDLLIQVAVEIPTDLTDEDKAAIMSFKHRTTINL